MRLDFGGIVKEYAADPRRPNVVATRASRTAIVDLGGDLAVVGAHPDGAPWLAGIKLPSDPGAAPARTSSWPVAALRDERRLRTRVLVIAGKRYSHIVDPHGGLADREFRQCPA